MYGSAVFVGNVIKNEQKYILLVGWVRAVLNTSVECECLRFGTMWSLIVTFCISWLFWLTMESQSGIKWEWPERSVNAVSQSQFNAVHLAEI